MYLGWTIDAVASLRGFLSASEAAARLGVKPATLYAYVSRGLLRSEAEEKGRLRRYAARDVDHLLARRRESGSASGHGRGAERPWLRRGQEVILDSAICLIDGKKLYYRGLDAVTLAGRASYESVCTLLWTGTLGAGEPWGSGVPLPPAIARGVGSLGSKSSPLAQLQMLLPLLAACDESRFDTSPTHVVVTAKKIISNLVRAISRAPSETPRRRRAAGVGEALFSSLSGQAAPSRGGDAIDCTLVLCAEHELNASTFAARVAASAGADPYAVVMAALSRMVRASFCVSCTISRAATTTEAPQTSGR